MADITDDLSGKNVGSSKLVKSFVEKGSLKVFFGSSKKSLNKDDIPDVVSALISVQEKGNALVINDEKTDGTFEIDVVNDKVKLDTKASRFVDKLNNRVKDFNDDANYVVVIFNQDKFNEFRANHEEPDKLNSLSKFISKEFKKQLSEDKVKDVLEEFTNDNPVTLFEPTGMSADNIKGNGKAAVVVINDFNSNLTEDGYSLDAPDADRIVEEKGLTDEMLRLSTAYHEIHHALDNTDYTKFGGGLLGELYTAYRMEAKADIGAMVQSYKDNGDFRASEHDEFIRANNTYEGFRAATLTNSILSGSFTKGFDKESITILAAQESLEEASKNNGQTSKAEEVFLNIDEVSDAHEQFSDLGGIASYNTSPLLKKMHTLLKGNKSLLQSVTEMKMKEFNNFVDGFLDENALSKPRFAKLIVDMSDSYYNGKGKLIIPQNKDLIDIVNNKHAEDKKMGVSTEVAMAFETEKNFEIIDEANEFIHSSVKGEFFDDGSSEPLPASDYEFSALNKWMDGLARKIEQESNKLLGDETKGFNKVISAEINDLRKHKQKFSDEKLKLIEDFFLGNKKEADLRMNADKEVKKALSELSTPEISERGDDLVIAHIANQMSKLDVAEKGLKQVKNISGKVLSFKDRQKQLAEISDTYDDIIKHEKLAQGLATRIVNDEEAKSTLGKSKIIESNVTAKSGGRFPHWVRDFLVTVNEGAPEKRVDNLIARLDEKRRMFVSEVYQNKDLFNRVLKADEKLANRIASLHNFSNYKGVYHSGGNLKNIGMVKSIANNGFEIGIVKMPNYIGEKSVINNYCPKFYNGI